VKEEGKYFGRNPALAREAPPLERLEQEAEARANSKSFRYEDRTKPQVPDKRERPVMGIKTSKNFITANAVEAILQVRILLYSTVLPSFLLGLSINACLHSLTPHDMMSNYHPPFNHSSIHTILTLLLITLQVPKATENGELNYMKKEDFGKVPSYLIEVKEEIRRENEMIDKYVKEQMGHVEEEPDRYEEVSHSERQALIDALKAKWDKVNAGYQKITHLTQLDTAGQVRRKEHFESTMSALEQDIEKLSRPGPLLMKV
jgi:hypothetical protein